MSFGEIGLFLSNSQEISSYTNIDTNRANRAFCYIQVDALPRGNITLILKCVVSVCINVNCKKPVSKS